MNGGCTNAFPQRSSSSSSRIQNGDSNAMCLLRKDLEKQQPVQWRSTIKIVARTFGKLPESQTKNLLSEYKPKNRVESGFRTQMRHPTRCNNQSQNFIALSYRYCSTCFGHYYAHHQEPVKLPLQPLVSVWMWRWKCSQPWSAENTSTSTFIRKPEAATAVWRAPDDGHCNARNMLSSICTRQ